MQEAIKSIVEESICNVVCIDDDYLGPFDNIPTNLDSQDDIEKYKRKMQFSKDMYDSVSESLGRNVSILPFTEEVDMNLVKRKFENTDLLILDWDLLQKDNNDTLQVIELAEQSSLPYVCIYTKNPDLNGIINTVKNYYLGYSREDVADIVYKAESAGMTKDDFLELLEKAYNPKKNTIKTTKIKEKFDELFCKADKFSLEENEALIKLMLGWKNAVLPFQTIKREINVLKPGEHETQNIGLKISDSYVLAFQKTSEDGFKFNTDSIIPQIGQTMVSYPNSAINGIWSFYTNMLRKTLKKDGNYFIDVSWKTFAHYACKLSEIYNDAEMNRFLKSTFVKKVSQQMEAGELELAKVIVDRIKEEGKTVEINQETKNEFFKLNSFLNMNYALTDNAHSLTFGDIIKSDDNKYYICVTALCDCTAHNNDLPKDYMYFVEGEEKDAMDALKNAETDQYSFICEVNEKAEKRWFPIKWKRSQLKPFFIKAKAREVSRGSEIKANVGKSKRVRFIYICNISQEYAQRIANESFSWANRVGVSYATKS